MSIPVLKYTLLPVYGGSVYFCVHTDIFLTREQLYAHLIPHAISCAVMQTALTNSIINAVASAEMEGLHPTEKDIARIRDFVEKKITRDELIAMILSEIKEVS